MSERLTRRTLDDLLAEATKACGSHRDAAFGLIREIENGEIVVIDLHTLPYTKRDVLRWIVSLLEGLANWKQGAPLPSFPYGVAEYLKHLRFSRIELKGPARAGAGRPEEYDWEDAKLKFLQLIEERGDPEDPAERGKGWRSMTDVSKAILEYMEKRAEKTGTQAPDLSTIRRRVSPWLTEWRAQK
jgi:hypothetical protein